MWMGNTMRLLLISIYFYYFFYFGQRAEGGETGHTEKARTEWPSCFPSFEKKGAGSA